MIAAISKSIHNQGIVVVLLAACIILSFLSPHFLTTNNIINIFMQVSINTILAVGMTFVILTGGIDLSVGATVALASVVLAIVHKSLDASRWESLYFIVVCLFPMILALLTGVAVGLVNGVMVSRYHVPAFIMTLGMMSIARGLAYMVTNNETISVFPSAITFLGKASFFGFPVLVLVCLVVVAIAALVLHKTIFGRYVYALGGNRTALRLSGINASAVEIGVYAISGLTAGLAAIALVGRLNTAQPVAGIGYELDAIAAVIIGGTSIFGGEGRVFNSLLGALLVGVIRNGLNLLNVSPTVQLVVIGSIIVGAVVFDKARSSSSTES
jgi:ribose transport system permease protein